MEIGDKVKISIKGLEDYMQRAGAPDSSWRDELLEFHKQELVGEVIMVVGDQLFVNFTGTPCCCHGVPESVIEKVQKA